MLLSISISVGGIEKTLIHERDVGPYIIKVEMWSCGTSDKPIKMISAYAHDGSYIGNVREAKLLAKRGIVPERNLPEHNVASIGKSSDGKWYGWSHRAIHGFSIGDKIKEGDCGYHPDIGEWTIETEQDAKRAAADFAESVSSDQQCSVEFLPVESQAQLMNVVHSQLEPSVKIARKELDRAIAQSAKHLQHWAANNIRMARRFGKKTDVFEKIIKDPVGSTQQIALSMLYGERIRWA